MGSPGATTSWAGLLLKVAGAAILILGAWGVYILTSPKDDQKYSLGALTPSGAFSGSSAITGKVSAPGATSLTSGDADAVAETSKAQAAGTPPNPEGRKLEPTATQAGPSEETTSARLAASQEMPASGWRTAPEGAAPADPAPAVSAVEGGEREEGSKRAYAVYTGVNRNKLMSRGVGPVRNVKRAGSPAGGSGPGGKGSAQYRPGSEAGRGGPAPAAEDSPGSIAPGPSAAMGGAGVRDGRDDATRAFQAGRAALDGALQGDIASPSTRRMLQGMSAELQRAEWEAAGIYSSMGSSGAASTKRGSRSSKKKSK